MNQAYEVIRRLNQHKTRSTLNRSIYRSISCFSGIKADVVLHRTVRVILDAIDRTIADGVDADDE